MILMLPQTWWRLSALQPPWRLLEHLGLEAVTAQTLAWLTCGATENHLLFRPDGSTVPAGQLRPGDWLLDGKGGCQVVAVRKVVSPGPSLSAAGAGHRCVLR